MELFFIYCFLALIFYLFYRFVEMVWLLIVDDDDTEPAILFAIIFKLYIEIIFLTNASVFIFHTYQMVTYNNTKA